MDNIKQAIINNQFPGIEVIHITDKPKQRKIYQIAGEIFIKWKKVNYAAKPYLDAMLSLTDKDDKYICDNASDIIRYFLCNASTWRGPDAKRIKLELKELIK